jgi:hypothetical protein
MCAIRCEETKIRLFRALLFERGEVTTLEEIEAVAEAERIIRGEL